MDKFDNKDKPKMGPSEYIQFGTFSISLLGSVIAVHVYDHLKNKESKSAEA